MHLSRLALALTLVPFTACRSKPAEEHLAASASASAANAAVVPAPSASARPAHGQHDHDGHDHDGHDHDGHDHANEDPNSLHAKLHQPPDPNAPPLQIPIGHTKVGAKPVAAVTPSPDDPLAGKFSVADATKGLPAKGTLTAEIRTDHGTLRCELYEDRAPITVANFVGLARGLRPFKNAKGDWVKKPAYDGTVFHRVERAMFLEAGDPTGTGEGGPGYVIPDEIWEDAYHYDRGLLCMATREPNQNGMRFFVLNGAAPHLDGGSTVFGKCGPLDVIDRIALVDVQGTRPVKPPKISKVAIRRVPPKKK